MRNDQEGKRDDSLPMVEISLRFPPQPVTRVEMEGGVPTLHVSLG